MIPGRRDSRLPGFSYSENQNERRRMREWTKNPLRH